MFATTFLPGQKEVAELASPSSNFETDTDAGLNPAGGKEVGTIHTPGGEQDELSSTEVVDSAGQRKGYAFSTYPWRHRNTFTQVRRYTFLGGHGDY